MNKTDFHKLLTERIIILDGATGTELQKRGFLEGVTAAEELNIRAPERIQAVYRDYLEAGAGIILANTFGANRMKLADYGLAPQLEALNRAGIEKAKEAARQYNALVAGDVASLGSYLTPLGPVSFDAAYETFAEQITILDDAGADLLVIETMAEIREVKAALLAAKDHFKGPVLVQMTFTADGTTVTGTDILAFIAVAESMGADGIGMNCSVGPAELAKLAAVACAHTTLPVSFKPNAGMPKLVNRQTVFPGTVEEFVAASEKAYNAGVNLLGGCCGTTPAFIEALAQKLKGRKPAKRNVPVHTYAASRTKAIDLAAMHGDVMMIGERINPTNRKSFQEELLAGNFATLRAEARDQAASGAAILDINLGLPGADEKSLMVKAVEEIQEVVPVPLCLDSSFPAVLEAGIRACAGKPIINSVNGDCDRLDRILPLAKRYGACVIGLTTDEKGIPKSAADRLTIAERIINKAKEYSIPESELIMDYLTLSASAMADQLKETLAAISESKKRWPAMKTVLGVSNVSFGLPDRQVLNSTFLKLAREAGLDLAILNPHENWRIDDADAKQLLLGNDPAGKNYIAKHGNAPKKVARREKEQLPPDQQLYYAVIEGNREEIARIARAVLATGKAPLAVANELLLTALNEVGARFNRKEFFLPQVILAAEAAQAAFAEIKPLLKKGAEFNAGTVVLATVKGDVHDIGKNIVAAVLESHGWDVVDLGKNVEADAIVQAARERNASLIGISALMTTTMLEMENVIDERDKAGLAAKVMVGGAPVTDKFAKEIGADGYAKDAVSAAGIARELTAGK